jgi:hypothetical protein
MDTSQLTRLADHVGTLPAGTSRDRQLQQLTDEHAAAAAASALQAAAAGAGPDAGVLTRVLSSASAARDGGRDDLGLTAGTAALDRLRDAVASPAFRSLVPAWIRELREVAAVRPDTGACTLATTLQLWSWTMDHLQTGQRGSDRRPHAVAELAEALSPLIAARCLVMEIAGSTSASTARPDGDLRADLCHVHAAHAAASIGATCAELVFGYRRHLVWDAEGCAGCYSSGELDDLEGLIPGLACAAYATGDVVEADGSHAAKAGPCVRFDGVERFVDLRARLDGCLSGARFAKDRAAATLARTRTVAASREGR